MRRAVTLFVALAVLVSGATFAAERPLEEAKLAKLRATIEKVRKDLDRTRDRYDRTRREIRSTEERIGVVAKSLRVIDQRIDQQHRRVAEVQARSRRTEASVAHQRDQLSRQVRAAYATGQQEYLRLLLNQENPATVGRVVAYYDYFNRARADRIGALQASMRELQALRSDLEQETARLEALRAEQAGEKSKLEESRRERSVLLLRLRREMSSKDQRLDGLKADARELEAVLRALRDAVDEQIPAGQPFKRLRGRLPWPAKGPLQARFGAPRADGKLRWEGVLIRARPGQEVRAVARGRVAFADWLRGYGLLVVIDHGDGFMSLYGHNQSLFKETGDWVDTNTVIATVGDSGGQEAEALYFEIRHNGKPLDPAKWVRR